MLSLLACSPFRLPPTRCGARRKSMTTATIMIRSGARIGSRRSKGGISALRSSRLSSSSSVSPPPPAASVDAAVEPKLRCLLKADMVAVFCELAAQGEALQVRAAIFVLAAPQIAHMKLLGMALVAILALQGKFLTYSVDELPVNM
jgi:hypothetical protein